MDNKKELLEAIDNYSVYTSVQRKILKTLIEIEIEGKAVIDVLSLSKIAKTSPTAIYKIIKLFEKDNILQVLPTANKKINSFLLKKSRLDEMKRIAENISRLR